MTAIPHLVGMVHLQPLPGSPLYGGSMSEVADTAVADAETLADAGFPCLLIENFGDVPFHAEKLPPETIASLTVAVDEVRHRTGLPIGVNALRNDAKAALGIAVATSSRFIRVNVLTGTMFTDQGMVTGRADELLRLREHLGAQVEVWADVMVKHAVAPPGLSIQQAALDTVERGLADAVIVSGAGTGAPVETGDLEEVRAVLPKVRIVVGSGTQPDNLARLAPFADTFIIGSYLKVDGDARNRVDKLRATRMVELAGDLGIV